jgi:hypothetical protein
LTSAAGGSRAADTYAKKITYKYLIEFATNIFTGRIDGPRKMDHNNVICQGCFGVVRVNEVKITDKVNSAHFGVVSNIQSSQQDMNDCITVCKKINLIKIFYEHFLVFILWDAWGSSDDVISWDKSSSAVSCAHIVDEGLNFCLPRELTSVGFLATNDAFSEFLYRTKIYGEKLLNSLCGFKATYHYRKYPQMNVLPVKKRIHY